MAYRFPPSASRTTDSGHKSSGSNGRTGGGGLPQLLQQQQQQLQPSVMANSIPLRMTVKEPTSKPLALFTDTGGPSRLDATESGNEVKVAEHEVSFKPTLDTPVPIFATNIAPRNPITKERRVYTTSRQLFMDSSVGGGGTVVSIPTELSMGSKGTTHAANSFRMSSSSAACGKRQKNNKAPSSLSDSSLLMAALKQRTLNASAAGGGGSSVAASSLGWVQPGAPQETNSVGCGIPQPPPDKVTHSMSWRRAPKHPSSAAAADRGGRKAAATSLSLSYYASSSSSASSPSLFRQLPVPVVSKILEYVEGPQLDETCVYVCQTWYLAVATSKMLTQRRFTFYPPPPPPSSLPMMAVGTAKESLEEEALKERPQREERVGMQQQQHIGGVLLYLASLHKGGTGPGGGGSGSRHQKTVSLWGCSRDVGGGLLQAKEVALHNQNTSDSRCRPEVAHRQQQQQQRRTIITDRDNPAKGPAPAVKVASSELVSEVNARRNAKLERLHNSISSSRTGRSGATTTSSSSSSAISLRETSLSSSSALRRGGAQLQKSSAAGGGTTSGSVLDITNQGLALFHRANIMSDGDEDIVRRRCSDDDHHHRRRSKQDDTPPATHYITESMPFSWVGIDFLDFRVLVTAYRFSTSNLAALPPYPTDWELQGCIELKKTRMFGDGRTANGGDCSEGDRLGGDSGGSGEGGGGGVAAQDTWSDDYCFWHVLDRRKGNFFGKGVLTNTFYVDPSAAARWGPMRRLRIVQTGRNSQWGHELCVSSIEVFGNLIRV